MLKDAKLLVKDGNILKAWDNIAKLYKYERSYISRDKTITEQEERRKLVIKLKELEKIASDSSKIWVIKYGKVLAVGEFIHS